MDLVKTMIIGSIVQAKTASYYYKKLLEVFLDKDTDTYDNENEYLQVCGEMKTIYELKKEVDSDLNEFVRNYLVKHIDCKDIMKLSKKIIDGDNAYKIFDENPIKKCVEYSRVSRIYWKSLEPAKEEETEDEDTEDEDTEDDEMLEVYIKNIDGKDYLIDSKHFLYDVDTEEPVGFFNWDTGEIEEVEFDEE